SMNSTSTGLRPNSRATSSANCRVTELSFPYRLRNKILQHHHKRNLLILNKLNSIQALQKKAKM
ncbi:hypothetical protein MUA04_00180, partial [Enterobacteriaceae bacterium H11S18]|uniref:hypothetical protein n=1 Tax=Dryocola clanedunensis TaxID=2925396 RepID=UPI0022F13EB3